MSSVYVALGHRPVQGSVGASSILACSGRRYQYFSDAERWGQYFPGKLTPRMADLLRLASAAYVADRVVLRDKRQADRGWARFIELSVEVSDLDFWEQGDVARSVTGMLDFLSGDFWDVQFVGPVAGPRQPSLPYRNWKRFADPPAVCLYSGGLDSAAGLLQRIRACPGTRFLPVLVRHQAGQGRLVRSQLKMIAEATGSPMPPLILPFWMRTPKSLSGSEENTQRTRSFLFCTAAGIAGALTNAGAIEMMEGGIGAMNLPLMAGMVGSKATRSSHPTFLRQFSGLLRRVIDRDLVITLPHLNKTKCELVRGLLDAGLESLVHQTASCVHYPLRGPAKQCGVCPACIFRRQALAAAGIQEPRGKYQHDLLSASGEVPDRELTYLKAFLWQIEKLSPLDEANAPPEFLLRHFRSTEVSADVITFPQVVDLYRRYRREWLQLIYKAQQSGWPWASMIAPTPSSR